MTETTFNSFRHNVHSQNGEDGVIAEILGRLGIATGQFAEFGAWDGKHLSNTYLLLERGWEGVYIEADATRYRQLVDNMKQFPGRVDAFNSMVEPTGNNCLDALLAQSRLRADFDVLSIDIDTSDWYIWHSLTDYRPTIVVIEINSFLPVGILQTHRGATVSQSSFSSTLALGKSKGYTLVCHTGNMIFVRDDVVSKLNLPQIELDFPEVLFDYTWVVHRQKRQQR